MGNRISLIAPLVAATVLVGTAVALGATGGVKVATAKYASLSSTILVDGNGRALYHLTSEKGKTIRCSGGCAATWPPVILAKGAKTSAGPGITRAKLGTVKRPDGRTQLTYGGLALYRYVTDSAGTASGQGIGKVWYVINSAGRIVTRAVVDTTTGGTTGGAPGGGTPDGGTGDEPGKGAYGY